MRRRLNHADLLIARRQYDLAEVVLEGIVDCAELYETFDEQLAALRLYHHLYFTIESFDYAGKFQHLIAECRRRVSVIETANQLYLLSKHPNATGIAERVSELREYAEEAPSLTATFLLLGAEANEQRQKNNYAAEQNLLRQQLHLALHNTSLKENNTIGQLYLDRCLNALHLRKFTKAVSYGFDAERYYSFTGDTDRQELRLLRYHSFIYSKRLPDAAGIIKEMNPDTLSPVWIYLKAVVEFLDMNYQEVIFLLARRKATFFSGTELGCWPFILAQMAIIAQAVKDERKVPVRLLNRLRSSSYMKSPTSREMAASKIIGMLVLHKFDFRKVHVEAQAYYHLLHADKNEFAWNMFTPELIPFDEWFFSFISNNNLYKQINYNR